MFVSFLFLWINFSWFIKGYDHCPMSCEGFKSIERFTETISDASTSCRSPVKRTSMDSFRFPTTTSGLHFSQARVLLPNARALAYPVSWRFLVKQPAPKPIGGRKVVGSHQIIHPGSAGRDQTQAPYFPLQDVSGVCQVV